MSRPADGSSASVRTGILKATRRGAGFLYDPAGVFPLELEEGEVLVRPNLVQQYHLVEGATVSGPVRQGKQGLELSAVQSVCGLAPEAFQQRPPFASLVAIDPTERFHLATSGETGMRIIDLIAPIGKGTRGLIVSPPKAGKTILLEQIAQAIRADEPDARIIVMLIDERPEEVTYFRRAVDAQVFASSSDQSLRHHVSLTEFMLAHIRIELECGHDVVVLLDSLTRMCRTFNLRSSARGRTLSGGLEAGALELPRRFFGVARNIENGGSVTILATILIDTGSRMDQFIFEEFKGTGNSEIVLDRGLAEARVFPAIDLVASSTRKAERLYSTDENLRLARLRRSLANRKPEEAIALLLRLLDRMPTNEELLKSIPLPRS
jgi:transcription termination factor Rho